MWNVEVRGAEASYTSEMGREERLERKANRSDELGLGSKMPDVPCHLQQWTLTRKATDRIIFKDHTV